ncbi:MAG TPA: M48 family metallopeptidase [Firmicutes bacterium]|nr:M48 family metallopeptidase [Candidatus Fermentithermobacillaceae bacterium]
MWEGYRILKGIRFLLGIALGFTALWLIVAVLPRKPSQEATRYFDAGFLETSMRHATLSYLSSGLETVAVFMAMYFLVAGELRRCTFYRVFSGRAIGVAKGAGLGALLYAMVGLFLSFVSLPFQLYRGYYLEKSFGLSRMTISMWLLDYAKSTAFTIVVYVLAGALTASLALRFPRTWPYLLTVVFLVGNVFSAFIYPQVVAPAFDKFVPLEDPVLLQEVRALSGKAGMKVDKVLVMEASRKTARSNAYFAGIGSTKQVVLYDTLLSGNSLNEVRLVLAHELGHWRFGHVVKGILASTAGAFVVLAIFAMVSGSLPKTLVPRDLSRFLLALFVFASLSSYVLTPAGSFLSRRFEAQADRYSIALTGDSISFVSAQVNLARSNLGDVEPPPFIRWFAWTHPTTLERIRMAEGR